MPNMVMPTLPCKVVVLGDAGVGKSSIISRFTNNIYIENNLPTLGNCYSSRIVHYDSERKSIKYEIWDTAGQEKYRSLSRIFYQSAEVIVLVYDITNHQTFDSIEQFWVAEITENARDNLAFILIGNKSDLYEYEEVNDQEAKEMAEKIGASYYLITARNNSTGIEDVFHSIGKSLLKTTNPHELSPLEKSIAKTKSSLNVTLDSSFHSTKHKKKKPCC